MVPECFWTLVTLLVYVDNSSALISTWAKAVQFNTDAQAQVEIKMDRDNRPQSRTITLLQKDSKPEGLQVSDGYGSSR